MKKMKTKVILPLKEPFLKVNSHHAFSFSVILTSEISLPWIFSNYISLYGVTNKEDGDFIFFLDWSRFHSMPYTFVMQLQKSFLDRKFSNIIDFILDCLENELYINLLVDEFFIPNTWAYNQKHFTHNLFVYGYDLEKKILYIAGYFGSPPQYKRNMMITFTEFMNSYTHTIPINALMNQVIELVKFPYFEPPYHHTYTLDTKLIKRSILDYIESTELHTCLVPNENFNYTKVYGLKVYDLLQDRLVNNLNIHMKALQTLVEHKTLMVERLKYLLAQKAMNDSTLVNDYSTTVVKNMSLIHLLYIKYRLTNKHNILGKIITNINTLKDKEKSILYRIEKSIY